MDLLLLIVHDLVISTLLFLDHSKGNHANSSKAKEMAGLSGMSLRADYWQMSPSEWDLITG